MTGIGPLRSEVVTRYLFILLEPDDNRVLGNVEFYKDELRKMYSTGARGDTGATDDNVSRAKRLVTPRTSKKDEWEERRSHFDYERLCRGETKKLVRFAVS